MASSPWPKVPIISVCTGIYDGPHATPLKTDCGPVFLGISNLAKGRLELREVEHLSESDFQEWTRRVTPRPDDVVFSYETRLGEAAIIPEGLRCCLGRRMALMRPDPSVVDARFLLYAYLAPEFQDVIRSRTVPGSTVDRIPLIEFPAFPICLPSLPEQRAVAHILGTLDDKIELNRRMNETLEAMARALFKSWFVDFDPVHAKAEGRQPVGMDAEMAALFPDGFEDSELGEIPRGWRVCELGAVAGINERSATTALPHSVIDYIDIASVRAGELTGTTSYQFVDAPSRARRLVQHGDTIWSTVRPNLKAYLFIHEPASNLVVSTGFAVLTPHDIPPSYLYALTTTDGFVDYLISNADGSAYPAVRADRFAHAPVLVPSPAVLTAFERLVGPMRDRIAHGQRESKSLAAIRDALLPKLLSGEIRVSDAGRVVEEVTA